MTSWSVERLLEYFKYALSGIYITGDTSSSLQKSPGLSDFFSSIPFSTHMPVSADLFGTICPNQHSGLTQPLTLEQIAVMSRSNSPSATRRQFLGAAAATAPPPRIRWPDASQG